MAFYRRSLGSAKPSAFDRAAYPEVWKLRPAAAFAADLSEVAVNRLCRRFGDTCTISFLRSSPSLRFGVIREGQYRARARVSELLVNASIEVLDQFVDDCEPASPLNICRSRAIVCHAAFDKLAGAL
jgi:hypothetical protein